MPEIINSENETVNEKEINFSIDLFGGLFDTELDLINNNNTYCQLDVFDNLGGSYLEINYDKFSPEDPTYKYHLKRINVKKYMKIFEQHICDNVEHPINQIICIFNKIFSLYIKTKLNEIKSKLVNKDTNEVEFCKQIKNLEKEITECLQEFITIIHSTVKLYYSASIDLQFFEDEKDDLINMITTFIFRKGNLYESLLDLYGYCFKDELQNFQDKLIELKNIRPKKLGIGIKFCLDQDTINLQNELKKKPKKNVNDEQKTKYNKEIIQEKKNSYFKI